MTLLSLSNENLSSDASQLYKAFCDRRKKEYSSQLASIDNLTKEVRIGEIMMQRGLKVAAISAIAFAVLAFYSTTLTAVAALNFGIGLTVAACQLNKMYRTSESLSHVKLTLKDDPVYKRLWGCEFVIRVMMDYNNSQNEGPEFEPTKAANALSMVLKCANDTGATDLVNLPLFQVVYPAIKKLSNQIAEGQTLQLPRESPLDVGLLDVDSDFKKVAKASASVIEGTLRRRIA